MNPTKRYSITGWWSQPNFPALAVIDERAALVRIDNTCLFTGVLYVDENGEIDPKHSILLDKAGVARIKKGTIDRKESTLTFIKTYIKRQDVIVYIAKLSKTTTLFPVECWSGTFEGDAVGCGFAKFVLQELPDVLFIDDVAAMVAAEMDR